MTDYRILHKQESEDGKFLSLHVDAPSMLLIRDVQRKVITIGYDFVFVNYTKRKNVFNLVKNPKKFDKEDMLEAIYALYPTIPQPSWHTERNFVVLRDPRDLLLLALSF